MQALQVRQLRGNGGRTDSAVWWAALSTTASREYWRWRVPSANTYGGVIRDAESNKAKCDLHVELLGVVTEIRYTCTRSHS